MLLLLDCLASSLPGVWAVKEAIFSLCYPRNYLVFVLPWCFVHFCWKMLVCLSALRRNGEERYLPWKEGVRPGGQRTSSDHSGLSAVGDAGST